MGGGLVDNVTLSGRVAPSLLTDQVYTMIREAILRGEMPAGTRLRIRDLAAQVGTSVMPVREAIRRLEEAGLAERSPHKGAVVKGLTLAELLHVYDVRRLLEVEAARLGAQAITPAEVDEMRAEYELMCTALAEREVIAYLDHDEALLSILYQAAGNPVLLQTIRALWSQCRAYKIVGAQGSLDSSTVEELRHYQERLVVAAGANDPAAASAANEESLVDAMERIRLLLAAQETAAGTAAR
jgi:DNA-binding GntR family transcriptional regulator